MGIYIALGANQPAQYRGEVVSPQETFLLVVVRLQQFGINIVQASNLWQSPAWPDPDAQPPYINGVIAVETQLEPLDLLAMLKQAEAAFGRIETVRNAPRPLDLDILDYNGQIKGSETLILPHPRMLTRPFVLMPLSEVAPDWRDPMKKRAITEWIARLALEDTAPLQRLGQML
ncbi:MAG: 2-amino-4-hydroxy-6-hydroxymethyldihydropteridine diphosphokinase [Robiginitomaculum sp.]|nr:MAG: 2-amino-4-hydroxy-6-hydroxymethyldihydropteridine diphosphokinase [Robiginitomaculum sp.]